MTITAAQIAQALISHKLLMAKCEGSWNQVMEVKGSNTILLRSNRWPNQSFPVQLDQIQEIGVLTILQ